MQLYLLAAFLALCASVSHSYYVENRYGDLDPRFLETAPTIDDVVTEYSVNPTTRLSRKGNFERNNSAAMVDSARARAAYGHRAVAGMDRNDCPQSTSFDAAKTATVDEEASARNCCLGLYVGPSLHENLAWRVKQAERKMKLAQPGGVGYTWLRESGCLITTSGSGEGENLKVASERPDSTFICKGYLFELLAAVKPAGTTVGRQVPLNALDTLAPLVPRPCASVLCSSVSGGHLKGWWCEWPELQQRFELIDGVEKTNIGPNLRWAVLTKRHWLSPAVARANEMGIIW